MIFPIFIGMILWTRITSVGSLSASLAGGIAMIVFTSVMGLPPIFYLYGIAVPGLIWLFHADNIARLRAGEERHMSFGSKKPKANGSVGGSKSQPA